MTDSLLSVKHQQDLFIHRQQTITMAHELDLSVTRYLQIKDKLVPKHLMTSDNQRKKDLLRKQMRQDLQFDTIQKQKYNRMKPIKEIQTIMKHFHSKFSNKQTDFSLKSMPKKKRMLTAHDELDESQRDLQTRMSDLIHLPEIKQKRKAAEKYRYYLLADQIKQKQLRKAKIMEDFNNYIEAEMKGNHRPSNTRRLHTIN